MGPQQAWNDSKIQETPTDLWGLVAFDWGFEATVFSLLSTGFNRTPFSGGSKWLWVKTQETPGEHQNRWQMDVPPPQNGN